VPWLELDEKEKMGSSVGCAISSALCLSLLLFIHPNMQDSAALLIIVFAEITGWFTVSLKGLLIASRSLSEGIEEQRTLAYIMRAIHAILLFGPIAVIIAFAMFENAPSR